MGKSKKPEPPCVGIEETSTRELRTGRKTLRTSTWRLFLYAKSLPVYDDVILDHVCTEFGCPERMMESGRNLAEELNIPFVGIVE